MTETFGSLETSACFKIEGSELSFSYCGGGTVPGRCGDSNCFPYSDLVNDITSVKFNSGITTVSKGPCENLINLKTVYFPSTVSSIASGSFYNSAIETINIDPANTKFRMEDKMLIRNEDQTILFVINRGGTLTIPSTVLSIGSYSIRSAHDLTNIIIPESVVQICSNGFSQCNFEEISIPNIKSIDSGAFSSSKLKSIILPEWIDAINSSMFYNCVELTKVIAFSLKRIDSNAFFGCTSLKDFRYNGRTVPVNTSNCFNKCNNLRGIKVTIIYPSDSFCSLPVIRIRTYVYKNCFAQRELFLITFLLS